MDSLHIKELEQEAAHKLSQASYCPKKLALIHAGVSLAVTAVLAILHLLLSRGISTTGGLAGIGTRTALESIRYILQLAASIALPFWEMGFIYCALGFSREQTRTPENLTAGFRRIGTLVRSWLLQGLLYFAVAFAALQIVSIVYAVSPFSRQMMVIVEQLLADPTFLESGNIAPEIAEQLFRGLIPVYAFSGLLFLVLAIPLAYRLRMTPYRIFEEDRPRAIQAMAQSRAMMRSNCKALFQVDLHFWWYYLLQVLVALVSNLDILLPAAGVTLPVREDAAFLVFLGVHTALSLLMAWQLRSRVETVYACVYNRLLPQEGSIGI